MPRVTILMPTYNVAPWVKESIDSVLAQTYTDFELLVLDDCSSDNTVGIVRSYVDPRIRIVEGEHNVGLSENLNKGLSLSNTELLARMDGDDIAEPTWLERGVAVLDEHPEIGICSFGFQFFGTKSTSVRFPEHHEDSMAQMLFGCTVIIPVLRKSVFTDHNFRYSTDAFPAEDYMMWAHCYRVAKVYNVQETMFHYRTHATQISTAKRQAQIEKSNAVRRYMLEWLNPNLEESEIRYFLDTFVPGEINDSSDLRIMQDYAKKMVEKNDVIGHFSHEALVRKFHSHIVQSLYHAIVARYFSAGYSVRRYCRYILSGLAFHTEYKYEIKFLVKSLLHKKK